MIKICFVILNYNLVEETILCINSIREKIDTSNYHIIIVDNASRNNAVKKIQTKYSNDKDITIISLENNIGFAQGNNIGIKKAREIGAQFVCCLNDDTKLISEDFYTTLEKKYQEYLPAVIGPAIMQSNGQYSTYNHPQESIDFHKNNLEKWKHQKYHFSIKNFLRNNIFKDKKLEARVRNIYGKLMYKGNTLPSKDIENLVLDGSCLIFTPIFFRFLEGFNPQTFLYAEEEFLFADLKIKGLRTLYVPSIVIYHEGGVSTKKASGKEMRLKWAFRQNHLINSHEKLVKYLQENEEDIYHVSNSK